MTRLTSWRSGSSRKRAEIGAAGQGSIAAEVREQLPEVENIIVPMGSGGLAIAVASYFKQRDPSVKVYAVEASNSPSLVEFLKANRWQKTFDVLTDGEPLPLITPTCWRTFFWWTTTRRPEPPQRSSSMRKLLWSQTAQWSMPHSKSIDICLRGRIQRWFSPAETLITLFLDLSCRNITTKFDF